MFLRYSWIFNDKYYRWELVRVEDQKVFGWIIEEVFISLDTETIKRTVMSTFGIPLPEEAYDTSARQ